MFESLTDKLELTFKRLRGQGKITENNIDEALREVRLALLEADVHVKVVKTFLDSVKTKSMGQEVLQSLSPEAREELRGQVLLGAAVESDRQRVLQVVEELLSAELPDHELVAERLGQRLSQGFGVEDDPREYVDAMTKIFTAFLPKPPPRPALAILATGLTTWSWFRAGSPGPCQC